MHVYEISSYLITERKSGCGIPNLPLPADDTGNIQKAKREFTTVDFSYYWHLFHVLASSGGILYAI